MYHTSVNAVQLSPDVINTTYRWRQESNSKWIPETGWVTYYTSEVGVLDRDWYLSGKIEMKVVRIGDDVYALHPETGAVYHYFGGLRPKDTNVSWRVPNPVRTVYVVPEELWWSEVTDKQLIIRIRAQ